MTKFMKYQHVERLGVDEVSGLLDGYVVVQPKIDGTNASVWLDGSKLCFGSRKRQLSIEKDNAGFMNHFLKSDGYTEDGLQLLHYLTKHPDYTIYGEWLVQHKVKYIGDNYRQFYIFDIYDHSKDKYLPISDYTQDLHKYSFKTVKIVPVLSQGKLSEKQIVELAKSNHYLLNNDSLGEGIVVKRYNFVNRYGDTVWGKYVLADFQKSNRVKNSDIINPYDDPLEKLITPAFVEKEFLKFKDSLDHPFGSKDISALLGTIYHELISEETWHLLKLMGKDPVVDFGEVKRTSYKKIKRNLSFLFGEA